MTGAANAFSRMPKYAIHQPAMKRTSPNHETNRVRFPQPVKPENVQRNEDQQPGERSKYRWEKDLVGERLLLLDRELQALREQVLVHVEDANRVCKRTDQDRGDKHPRPPPCQSSRREKQ